MKGKEGSITEEILLMLAENAEVKQIRETQRRRMDEKLRSLLEWVNGWAEVDTTYLVFVLDICAASIRAYMTPVMLEDLAGLHKIFGSAIIQQTIEEGRNNGVSDERQ